ncbi:MAG TPA: nitroreductase family deazaflavin-dependent oxidoreductase [Chloroflexi bacterium]|nr:nitroreductase family deazaflavin-dependent oxidoreductase [Chloroflexota bacterium]HAF21015.1 nitroreductase family deazaflavin-dependent oxidoreductase [Chloroflexota bacterium]
MDRRRAEVIEVMQGSKLDESVQGALARGRVIDITTVGRQSGRPRRIEIVFHNIDGRIYISGIPSPTRRAWLANLEARPEFTVHLKGAVRADLPARARIIDDEAERRRILDAVARNWKRKDLETMVRLSPLIEVTFEGANGQTGHPPAPA